MTTDEAPTIVGYKHLSSNRFDYSFKCPIGVWKARLDGKAWGKSKGNLLLYFSELETQATYAISVFWTNGYGPERGVVNFKSNAEPGELFEIETARTRTGTVKMVYAVKRLADDDNLGCKP
jgi:hypothetical protein